MAIQNPDNKPSQYRFIIVAFYATAGTPPFSRDQGDIAERAFYDKYILVNLNLMLMMIFILPRVSYRDSLFGFRDNINMPSNAR